MGIRLRQSKHTLGELRSSLVPCVFCRNGMDVSPKFCGQDPRCPVCHGVKLVSLIPCRCGRPLRLDDEGFVAEGIYCCGRKTCREQLKPKEAHAEVIRPAYHYTQGDYTDYCC